MHKESINKELDSQHLININLNHTASNISIRIPLFEHMKTAKLTTNKVQQ